LTAHLEAHEGNAKYQIRCKTIGDIFEGTKSQKQLPDISCTSHYSFVLGDLNFRSELPDCDQIDEEDHKNIINELVRNKDWTKLNEIDELGRALRNKDCLVGFQTLFCSFPATFKLQRQKGYEYNDKRRPSYTDRILWKTGHGLEHNLRPIIYEPIDDFSSSDHKPIRCAFSVQMNETVRFRPKMTLMESSHRLIGRGGMKSGRHSMLFQAGSDNSPSVAHREHLHLFLSNMKCTIKTDSKKTSNEMSSYLCFISHPEEILRVHTKKKIMHRLLQMVGMKKRPLDSNGEVTSTGWPRTSIQEKTNAPDWNDEEIHFVIKTHSDDGNSVDLSGALMHITLLEAEGSNPIGSFTFNLVNMIKMCKQPVHGSSKLLSSRALLHSQNQHDDAYRSTGSLTKTRSIINLFNRSTAGKADNVASDLSTDDPTVSMSIDEALVLNGCETGRICCHIQGWWMNESTARAYEHFHMKLVDGKKERAPVMNGKSN
jgi:hypothetical protein